VYALDDDGTHAALGKAKQGVPLGDVWNIPYLNPKARERVGYPTQKPIELLCRLLEIASNPGDSILDPFCGSGTSLVAANIMGRGYIGIDKSEDAVRISNRRLGTRRVSKSVVAEKGRQSFLAKVDNPAISAVLSALKATPVYRNRHMDGFLKDTPGGVPVGLRILLEGDNLDRNLTSFVQVLHKKKCAAGVLVHPHAVARESMLFEQRDPVLLVTLEKALAQPESVMRGLEDLLNPESSS
jgi:site-specific DNA-methyltransferase (adenine-specific)